ncbi:MAG: hypothetical protein H7Z15_10550 [Rhizobacter sp.]|nr:hypothetical protein [Rhizobacter sp.]
MNLPAELQPTRLASAGAAREQMQQRAAELVSRFNVQVASLGGFPTKAGCMTTTA